MYAIAFWKSWSPYTRRLFWFFAAVAVLAIGSMWIANIQNPSPVIDPVVGQEIQAVSFDQHSFRLGAFELTVPAEAFLLFERTRGGLLEPNFSAGYIFLTMFVLALMAIMSLLTTLNKYWFFTGVGFFLLILFSLQLESVVLFGFGNYLPTIVIGLLFAGLASWFALVKTSFDFISRYISFIALAATIALAIHFGARAVNPFQHVAASALMSATVLTVIFIFSVAHEVLAATISLVSRGTRQTRSLQHFMIISFFYLFNLGLIYANRKFLIQWNFLPVNLMLFITLSGILGLWGFRQREPQYENIVKAQPSGIIVYLSLAIIGFSTLCYVFSTANDPVIKFAEDCILYSHLGYGIIFFIYVINNFGSLLYQNMNAARVLYRPDKMPYFTFRVMGLIVTFIFFAYSNWRVSMHQVFAGYYNASGDIYLKHDTLNLAEGYYQKSVFFAQRNCHAHYALAQLYAAQKDVEKEKKQYQLMADTRPLDFGYLNLSQIMNAQFGLRTSMEVLQLGLTDFPGNGRLETELGLGFADLNQQDSSLYHARRAINSSSFKTGSAINYLGLLARFKSALPADSLLGIADENNAGVRSNALALACIQGVTLPVAPINNGDTVLSAFEVTSLHNFLISQGDHPDTTLIKNALDAAHKADNPYFKDFLLSSAAYAYYNNGQTGPAIKALREAAYAGQQEKYFDVLGLWCLEQNVPNNATAYFSDAIKQDFPPAHFHRAISLSESGDADKAIHVWDSLANSSNEEYGPTAKKTAEVLHADDPSKLSDEGKYIYSRYRIGTFETERFESLVNTMASPDWKAKTILDYSRKLDEADELDLAAGVLDAGKGLPLKDPALYQELLHQQLRYVARKKNWSVLQQMLRDKALVFTGKYRNEKLYYDALIAIQENKNDMASRNFKWLLAADPFFEDAVVAGLAWLGKDDPKSLALYSSLVAALDFNPGSVKLLKVYAIKSLLLDFDDAGQTTLDRLKTTMSREAFIAFLKENPELFEVKGN